MFSINNTVAFINIHAFDICCGKHNIESNSNSSLFKYLMCRFILLLNYVMLYSDTKKSINFKYRYYLKRKGKKIYCIVI